MKTWKITKQWNETQNERRVEGKLYQRHGTKSKWLATEEMENTVKKQDRNKKQKQNTC